MHPRISYLVYATPRCGSYLLCEALINTRLAGRPAEYFGQPQTETMLKRWSLTGYEQCLAIILKEGTTPNGVFGGKIIWPSFEDFINHLREIPGCATLPVPELLSAIFPHLRHIWISRRDKVRQAISHWKAIQTDVWMTARSQHFSEKEVIFNYNVIERLRRSIEYDEQEMQQYFTSSGIQPFKVVYEDFVQNYQETLQQILDYLHIPLLKNLAFAEQRLKKQADEQSEMWVQRYYELKPQKCEDSAKKLLL
ncbi:MAG TPA: Stf0 family sulfotransferase [Ktedonosporobacter sp.]|jgi:LPS sulfotransferase NodH|nr:Stf0 family sulfotransferase [Ktedonosporobacter sp.]